MLAARGDPAKLFDGGGNCLGRSRRSECEVTLALHCTLLGVVEEART